MIDIPIIHFSVVWWNTLHQGSTLKWVGQSTIHSSMMWPLMVMLFAFFLFYVWAIFLRLRVLMVQYESSAAWMVQYQKRIGQ
jgi:heme exporter protein C